MGTPALMTFEQYTDLPEQEGVFRELDEGRVIEMPRPEWLHGALQARMAHLLLNGIERTGADFIGMIKAHFLLAPDVDRAPDVSLLRKSAFATREVVRNSIRGAPELAVEVVSTSDTAADLDRKVEQYLRAGTTAVWVLYSETRHVMVHRRSGETRKATSGQNIEEPDLLPGFTIAVDQIFAL